jgi:hypothetical protein
MSTAEELTRTLHTPQAQNGGGPHKTRKPRPAKGIAAMPPGALLAYNVAIAILLVVLLVAARRGWFGDTPMVIGHVLPLVVVWAGALGGVAKSVMGLAAHWPKMSVDLPADEATKRKATKYVDERLEWNVWHLTRPWMGAILGTVSTLIGVLVLGTVGVGANKTIDLSNGGIATLALISFVVGYQQTAFRQMLERVLNVLVGPGDPDKANDEPSNKNANSESSKPNAGGEAPKPNADAEASKPDADAEAPKPNDPSETE